MTIKPKITLLMTSAGRRGELVNLFHADAQSLGLDLSILGADMNPALSAACQIADKSFKVPSCGDETYISRLLEICEQERVDLLVPLIDTELAVLAAQKARFEKLGMRVVISDPKTIAICRDKLITARYLDELGIPTPRTHLASQLNRAQMRDWPYPLFAKPRAGSSSKGIMEINSWADIKALPNEDDRYIVQTMLRGREYTVNVFVNAAGEYVTSVPHLRLEIRAGEVSKGETRNIAALREISKKLVKGLPGLSGPFCFQAIEDERTQTFTLFEINPRFGGGFPLAHRAGATFSKWLLEEVSGSASSAGDNWTDGLVMLRYDTAVFTSAP